MYLFFDTETTGTPKNYQASFRDTDNWPRVIQLAFQVYTKEKKLLKSYKSLILPNGWTMPTDKFWIDNGFSQEQSIKEGVPISKALATFVNEVNQCKYLIAHNADFDVPIMQSEMYRLGFKAENRPTRICTMKSSTDFCEIPSWNGIGFKWPKLEEVHRKLFDEGFDGAHDALNDVKACAKVFFELEKREIIKL